MHHQKTALYVSYVWPEHKSSAAGVRSLQILSLLKVQGFNVGVASSCKPNVYQEALQAEGYWTRNWPLNRSEVDQEIKTLEADLVIFDRFVSEEQFSFRFRRYSPKSVLVLDMQDFHALRRARQANVNILNAKLKSHTTAEVVIKPKDQGTAELKIADKCQTINSSPSSEGSHWDFWLPESNCTETFYDNEDLARELGSILRSDQTLVISRFEYDLLKDKFDIPDKKLCYFPYQYKKPFPGNLSSLSNFKEDRKSSAFEDRKDFCMIGNYRHPPNLDSVNWTLTSLWPKFIEYCKKVDLLPLPTLYLYGAYTPERVGQLAKNLKNVKVMGFADNVEDALGRHRVLWAPLRFGAGLKGKIVEAMKSKTAVVTTPVGFEGLVQNAGENSEADFFKKAHALYTDSIQWKTQVDDHYKKFLEAQTSQLDQNFFSEMITRSLLLRQNDWVANVLKYQLSESEHYFSKWIEAKEVAGLREQKNLASKLRADFVPDKTSIQIIELLGLEPLPREGGYYRQVFKSSRCVCDSRRSAMTSVYYLLSQGRASKFHRLKSDEIYCFQLGSPVELITINKSGVIIKKILGSNIFDGQALQVTVLAGEWQASQIKVPVSGVTDWALLSTFVSPGFEFEDFEMADRTKMTKLNSELGADFYSDLF